MVFLALTLQLQLALQVVPQPVHSAKQYDVDIQVFRGADTVVVPGLRLADGLEGRLILSREKGAAVQVQTLVKEDPATRCLAVTIGFGEVAQDRDASPEIPRVSGQLCEGDTLRMKEEGGMMVLAKVRPAKLDLQR